MSAAVTLTTPAFLRQVTLIQEQLDRTHNEALEQAAKHIEQRVGAPVGYGLRVISAAEVAAELRGLKRGRM